MGTPQASVAGACLSAVKHQLLGSLYLASGFSQSAQVAPWLVGDPRNTSIYFHGLGLPPAEFLGSLARRTRSVVPLCIRARC